MRPSAFFDTAKTASVYVLNFFSSGVLRIRIFTSTGHRVKIDIYLRSLYNTSLDGKRYKRFDSLNVVNVKLCHTLKFPSVSLSLGGNAQTPDADAGDTTIVS